MRDRHLRLVGRRADVVGAVDARHLHDRGCRTRRCRPPGSFWKTSSPARIPFSRTACASAASSTTEPARGVDEVGARLHRRQELRVDQVLGLRVGGHVDRDRVGSAGPPRAGSGRTRCRAGRPPRASGCATRRPPSSRTPARARATSRPIWPSPTMPSVRPYSPRALEYSPLFHLPWRRSAVWSGMRRSQASRRPSTSSATAIEFLPGTVGDEDAELGRRGHVDGVDARRRRGSPA